MAKWKKSFLDHFCTAKNKNFALYWVTVRGGSDLTPFENQVFRPPKVVQKVIFQRSHKNKSC